MAMTEKTNQAAPEAAGNAARRVPASDARTARPERVDRYDPGEIEPRWRRAWDEAGLYRTDLEDTSRPKFYMLTMYPYPSGDLHVGHWYAMTPPDAIARFRRMNGDNAFLPMGFDAFGLPAENAAIERGIHPYTWTLANIEKMRGQLRQMGASFDWSKEIVTCEPEYYRWNQWFFLKFYERGLAYRAMAAVDWCPRDQATLAREQVLGPERRCWRCGTPVVKRDLEQWFFRITAYADELLRYDGLDWPEHTKVAQQNWIGRSEGAEIVFLTAPDEHQPGGDEIRVFTTRPDTLFGATFMVLAPEHALVAKLTHPAERATVEAYVAQARRETEIERLSAERQKSGVPTGSFAINPASGERIPIWVADYVLATYGGGAIMAVPAHDERDFEFATRFGLPIREVIVPQHLLGLPQRPPLSATCLTQSDTDVLVNSGRFDGLNAPAGEKAIVDWLAGEGRARATVQYRLRDWLISRQRYWGTPIPIVYCRDCGTVPVPEDQLPVLLPSDAAYRPTGESPLKSHAAFINTTCPSCDGPAERETDTMDTFVDSSWYWFRFLSPHLDSAPIDKAIVARWTPVDHYTGGAEHTVLHLLYFRFFTKAMADLGLIGYREPTLRLSHQGEILGADGAGMSKSRGNIEDPDEYVGRYGADAVRLFLMFIGPWDQGGAWNPRGIGGVSRFLHRVWTVALDPQGVERGDPQAGRLPAGESHEAVEAQRAVGGAPRHRGVRELPLQHHGRPPHGADQRPDALPGHARGRGRGVGRGGPLPGPDARPGGPPHQRGALAAAPGRGGRERRRIGDALGAPGALAGL